jgi:hypothetical protein
MVPRFSGTGTLVTGTLVQWYTGTQVRWYTATLTHGWFGTRTLVQWYTGTLHLSTDGTVLYRGVGSFLCHDYSLQYISFCHVTTQVFTFSKFRFTVGQIIIPPKVLREKIMSNVLNLAVKKSVMIKLGMIRNVCYQEILFSYVEEKIPGNFIWKCCILKFFTSNPFVALNPILHTWCRESWLT